MKQTPMKVGEWPAGYLVIPGMGEYFRMALQGKTPEGGDRMVVWNVLVQRRSDMDESDFLPVANNVAWHLLAHFRDRGWTPSRFVTVPDPRIVPTVSNPLKPMIVEGK